MKKKENTLFQMQASIYMGNVLKWLKFAKFLAPCILIEKLDERPHTSFQIHKISNGHKMFPIKCRLLFPVYFILSEEKWYIRGSAVDLKQKTSTCFLKSSCSQKNELILSQVSCEDCGRNNCFKLTDIHFAYEIFAQNLSFLIFQNYISKI